jgi:hypothetical protein
MLTCSIIVAVIVATVTWIEVAAVTGMLGLASAAYLFRR